MSVLRKLVGVFSSFGLTVTILAGMFVLTFLGTIVQETKMSLWDAQATYFGSWFVWHEIGTGQSAATGGMANSVLRFLLPEEPLFSLLLPGGLLLMSLLSVNLLVGGIVRMRWQWSRAGILISHFGIAMLLLAGLVKFAAAEEGQLALYEGEQSTEYHDSQRLEVVVFEPIDDGAVREYLWPIDEPEALARGQRVTLRHAELPFSLTLHDFVLNARLDSADRPVAVPVIEGLYLAAEPRALSANERNFAGCYATATFGDGQSPQTGILWDRDLPPQLETAPWTVTAGAREFGVKLRARTRSLPFEVRVDDFEADFHPGISMARSFSSDVTVFAPEAAPVAHHIRMNEPLRRDGFILFQSGWGPQSGDSNRKLYTVFSVVRNPSDQWPLWACIVIGIGLSWHFGAMLLRYISREQAARIARGAAKAAGGAALAVALLTGDDLCAQADPHAASPHAVSQAPVDVSAVRRFEWPSEVLELFQELPVQDEGRVKPLDTAVQFAMFRVHHKRTMHVPDQPEFGLVGGAGLTPIEWGLDAMWFPSFSDTYPSFTLEDSAILADLGLVDVMKRKRDRYSFGELQPGLRKLSELFSSYSSIESKRRTAAQNQVIALGNAIGDYRGLRHAFDFARARLRVPADPAVRAIFGDVEFVRTSEVMTKGNALMAILRGNPEAAGAGDLVDEFDRAVSASFFPRWIAPASPDEELWMTVRDLASASLAGVATPEQIELIRAAERFADSVDVAIAAAGPNAEVGADTLAAMQAAAASLHGVARDRAIARGVYDKIEGEVAYYRADWFYKALLWFLGGFILVSFAWFVPRGRWLARAAMLAVVVGNGLLIIGIVLRCLLRDRPPVTGLYDTILFIAAVAVSAALITEAINRRRVGLSVAALLGTVGMFLSMKYELLSKQDTMPELIAVLDTNFWLATHVTTVTMGYAAGLLAGAIAYLFLLGKLFGWRRNDRDFYGSLARMVYGAICFGLLFSTVGTILGGVWANDSWGRFWGWDPKENGALMIVLWFLMTLHARLGGYIKQYGMCLMAVVGAAVVSFSWWGVNQLGVGLHSYGFTSGISFGLNVFYAVTLGVFALGVLAWFIERRAARLETAV